MSLEHCEQEDAVIRAARGGAWGDGLRDHLAVCPACADAELVAEFLIEESRAAPDSPLPDPGTVWWKAQLRARRAAAERATRPIRIVERVAWACGLGSLVAAAIWQMPLILDVLKQPAYLLVTVLAAGLFLAGAATLYLVWSRE